MSFEQFPNPNESREPESSPDVLNEEPTQETFNGLGEVNTQDLREAIKAARGE